MPHRPADVGILLVLRLDKVPTVLLHEVAAAVQVGLILHGITGLGQRSIAVERDGQAHRVAGEVLQIGAASHRAALDDFALQILGIGTLGQRNLDPVALVKRAYPALHRIAEVVHIGLEVAAPLVIEVAGIVLRLGGLRTVGILIGVLGEDHARVLRGSIHTNQVILDGVELT